MPETEAIRFRYPWPVTTSLQAEVFHDWRYMAKQVIHQNGGSFRLLAALTDLIDMGTGETKASDEDLAEEAGRCGVKTISREVGAYRRMGIIQTLKTFQPKGEKNVRARIIRLAMPIAAAASLHVRDSR